MTRFFLDEQQLEKVRQFMKDKRVENTGAIGGQFTYSFTPTTLGTVVTITDCISKETLDVSDYDNW